MLLIPLPYDCVALTRASYKQHLRQRIFRTITLNRNADTTSTPEASIYNTELVGSTVLIHIASRQPARRAARDTQSTTTIQRPADPARAAVNVITAGGPGAARVGAQALCAAAGSAHVAAGAAIVGVREGVYALVIAGLGGAVQGQEDAVASAVVVLVVVSVMVMVASMLSVVIPVVVIMTSAVVVEVATVAVTVKVTQAVVVVTDRIGAQELSGVIDVIDVDRRRASTHCGTIVVVGQIVVVDVLGGR